MPGTDVDDFRIFKVFNVWQTPCIKIRHLTFQADISHMTTRDLSKMKKNGNPQISAEVTQEFPKVTRGRREMKGTC